MLDAHGFKTCPHDESRRVFYFNLTYTCNQNCRFCFSHNTNCERPRPNIALVDFSEVLSKVGIRGDDRIVLNGGEPTLHPDIDRILHVANERECEVVLYTNGFLFDKFSVVQRLIADSPTRITIPIHGDEILHDYITQVVGSWKKVNQGLLNLVKAMPPRTLELKFIVTREMCHEQFDISSFVKRTAESSDVLCGVVITGQVNTRKARDAGFLFYPSSRDLAYVEKQIMGCSEFIPTKFYDLPLCKFSQDFRTRIIQVQDRVRDCPCKFYFTDATSKLKEYVFPDRNVFDGCNCEFCLLHSCCSSICSNYNVTQIFQEKISRVFE